MSEKIDWSLRYINARYQWRHGLWPKKLWTSVAVPSQRLFASSVTSVTSVANDKGDNEMIARAVHRWSPDICLTGKENPGKPQLGDRLMKGCATSHGLKWGPLPLNEVGRIAQHVRKGEGRKERKDGEGRYINVCLLFI